MQMANKYMPYAIAFDAVSAELHLCAFSTVDQKQLLIKVQHLASRMTIKHRRCRAISQYQNFKFHINPQLSPDTQIPIRAQRLNPPQPLKMVLFSAIYPNAIHEPYPLRLDKD